MDSSEGRFGNRRFVIRSLLCVYASAHLAFYMYARRPRGNSDRVSRLCTQDLACRRDELRQDQRRGRGGRDREVVACGRECALQGGGQGEAREPRIQGLDAAPVILPGERVWGQQ